MRRHVGALALMAGASLASSAGAQPVLLQIRPRVGDTLNVRLEQQIDMTGTPAGCATGAIAQRERARASQKARSCAESIRHMSTRTEVFSRAIVRRPSGDATIVLAVTDSIRTSTSGAAGAAHKPSRAAGGRSMVELKVSLDGGAEVVDAGASDELRAVFVQMPAMLSRKAVAVGEKWVRQMRMPVAGESGMSGLVTATFQLDSLGRHGDVAYISMRGTLGHDHADGGEPDFSGTMTGAMQLDRRLGWITETRVTIDARSSVRPQKGSEPMLVRTRVTQRLKAGPAR